MGMDNGVEKTPGKKMETVVQKLIKKNNLVKLNATKKTQRKLAATLAAPRDDSECLRMPDLDNYHTGKEDVPKSDVLCRKSEDKNRCPMSNCTGALMAMGGRKRITEKEAFKQAKQFFYDYYEDSANHGVPELGETERMTEALSQLNETGTYEHTDDELMWAARTAWRNAPRCPARMLWKKLTVFDRREVTTTDEMFKALCHHIEFSFNEGNIKPAITVFSQRRPGENDCRVWNKLMISYAAYELPDGSVIGDKGKLEFTKFCQSLGWKGKGGQFDFLPLLLMGKDGVTHWYELPENLKYSVPLKDPSIDHMKLEWIAVPGVADMMTEAGGIQYTASSFTGWYQDTEVSTRDMLDAQRMDLLEPLADIWGFDRSSNVTMWQTDVALKLNKIVLRSYREAGVSIVDHYTQADQFMAHLEDEYKERGGCPADWVWIVPPLSGSLVPTFHQEMLHYYLSPAYHYQEDIFFYHRKRLSKVKFRTLAWLMVAFLTLEKNVTKTLKPKNIAIVYGTETGISKTFAKQATKVFSEFDVTTMPMNSVELYDNIKESFVTLIITSTFGNGESPMMGRTFEEELHRIKNRKDGQDKPEWLEDLTYAVFGLGSSAYPDLATFGKFVHNTLKDEGCKPILDVGIGDELKNQKHSFEVWLDSVHNKICKLVGIEVSGDALDVLNKEDNSLFRWNPSEEEVKVSHFLTEKTGYPVKRFKVLDKKIYDPEPEVQPRVMVIEFSFKQPLEQGLLYEPGGHLGVYPKNNTEDVEYLLSTLDNLPPLNTPLFLQEFEGKKWELSDDLPVGITLPKLLYYIFDLKKPPSQQLLRFLSSYAYAKNKARLTDLADSTTKYEKWLSERKNLVETIKQFDVQRIDCASLLGRLDTSIYRPYSIASAPQHGKIGLLVGVAEWKRANGERNSGFCSDYLLQAQSGDSVYCFLKPSPAYRLPEDRTKKLILICAGSGIAPFRSFWQERDNGEEKCHILLFFGCRKRNINLLLEETEEINKRGNVTIERFTAFSREPDSPREYVQDIILKHSDKIYDAWIKDEGTVYVCGKVSMAKGVRNNLKTLVKEGSGLKDDDEAEDVIKSLEKNGKYQQELFGE